MKQEVREGIASLIETMWAPITETEIEMYLGDAPVKAKMMRRSLAERKRYRLMMQSMNAILASNGYSMKDVATFLRAGEKVAEHSDVVEYKEYPRKEVGMHAVLRGADDEDPLADVFAAATVAPPTIEVKPKYKRPASPPADWSSFSDEEAAIKKMLDVTEKIILHPKYSSLGTKERGFVEDMNIRLNGGQWLTHRQLLWIDSINRKLER